MRPEGNAEFHLTFVQARIFETTIMKAVRSMIITKNELQGKTFHLLQAWCDELIHLQISMPGNARFDGAILCPACQVIHGRCHDAIYPMMYMADATGDQKYLDAAKKLFRWGETMLCDDGGLYNDAQSTWNGITVFNAVSLCDALKKHGHLLDAQTKREWEARLLRMGDWLFQNLRLGMRTNINYFATNCNAMALLGNYFDRDDYRQLARELARYCMRHISENGLLFGEGQPNDAVSEKGCRAIDMGGYNVEESLPSLCRYAMESGDKEAFNVFVDSYRAHLEFMLPDGAWDNSIGTRAFKWTYWGSRTSDGCQEVLFHLGKQDPVFAEAALRNLELYEKCTHDGLLFGGRDYYAHGEHACSHHTFCHAKVLAGALDGGFEDLERMPLPSDNFSGLKYYSEIDSYRVGVGDWRANVTAYDFNYMTGGHASGGALNLLWNRKTGPVIAVGAVDYSMHEIHNQQLSLKKAEHRSVCSRVELVKSGVRYANHYDFHASMNAEERDDIVVIRASAVLCDNHNAPIPENYVCTLTYTFAKDCVRIHGRVDAAIADQAVYYLPIVQGSAAAEVETGALLSREKSFNLNPGFLCTEYKIAPNERGEFAVKLFV